MFRSYSHHMVADLSKHRRSAFAAPTPLYVRAHGRCPQNRRTCANQQAELCVPKRIQPGQTCARQGRLTTHRRRLSPYADTGLRNVIPAQVTTIIVSAAAPRRRCKLQRLPPKSLTPNTTRHYRPVPVPAHRQQMAHRATWLASCFDTEVSTPYSRKYSNGGAPPPACTASAGMPSARRTATCQQGSSACGRRGRVRRCRH